MFISKYQGPQNLLKYMDNLLYPIDNYLFLSIDYYYKACFTVSDFLQRWV